MIFVITMKTDCTLVLPLHVYTAKQVLDNEALAAKHASVSLSDLMLQAGLVVYRYLINEYGKHQRYLVLTGKGNNAGDGFIVANELAKECRVTVLCIEDPDLLTGDALNAFKLYQQHGGEYCRQVANFTDYDVVIDALFGAGFHGRLPAEHQACIKQVNHARVSRISIDIPSGIDGNTGAVSANAFNAHATITFIGLKIGMLTGRAKEYVGRLYYAGLNVEQEFSALVTAKAGYLNEQQLLQLRPIRSVAGYKNQWGHVLLIGGGPGMAGAIRLAAEAALRTGAGLVSVATHRTNVQSVLQGRYELMVHSIEQAHELAPLIAKATCIVIGPGLGQSQWAQQLFAQVMTHTHIPLVIDADGLTMLAAQQVHLPHAILTPHSGEAGRLLEISNQEIELDRVAAIEQIKAKYQATVVLKGPGSLILGKQYLNINRSGCGAMASGGMGDVLSGMIAALLAQGLAPYEACCLAVYIHGLAAEQAAAEGSLGLLASDLFSHIRRLMG